MYVCMYIYIYIYTYIHVYIYDSSNDNNNSNSNSNSSNNNTNNNDNDNNNDIRKEFYQYANQMRFPGDSTALFKALDVQRVGQIAPEEFGKLERLYYQMFPDDKEIRAPRHECLYYYP